MIKKLFAIYIVVITTTAVANVANEKVVSALKPFIADINEQAIHPSPIDNMLMVIMGMDVLYVSADGRYVIQGDLIDLVMQKNTTAEHRKIAVKQLLSTVSNDEKITFKSDNEQYIVDIFTDIDCPYCRELHSQIDAMNQLGITVNYLAFPRAGVQSESYDKAVSVWCADDPQAAMTDAKNNISIEMKTCPNPVKKHLGLVNTLRVQGTPSIFLEDGTNIPGYLPPEKLLSAIKEELSTP